MYVARAGAGEEACIDTAASAEYTGTGIDDAVCGDEALGGRGGGVVGQGGSEGGQVGYVVVAVGDATALEEEDFGALGEGGGERAPGGAAADDDVVVVGHSRVL